MSAAGLVNALGRIGQVNNDTGLERDEFCAECDGWVNRDWTVAEEDGHVSCGTDCAGRIARAALATYRELESRGAGANGFMVLIKRETDPLEGFPFDNREEADAFAAKAGAQWSDTYIVQVLSGPIDVLMAVNAPASPPLETVGGHIDLNCQCGTGTVCRWPGHATVGVGRTPRELAEPITRDLMAWYRATGGRGPWFELTERIVEAIERDRQERSRG